MTINTPAPETAESLNAIMLDLGRRAKAAARILAIAPTEQKNAALRAMATAIRAQEPAILAANAEDVADGRREDLSSSLLDRLTLTPARLAGMAQGLEEIAELTDPVGQVMTTWTRPNGLIFNRVRVPLGVIAVIYESRPNVTADAGGLCLKSGNAVILRGGSDSFRSSRAIHAALVVGLEAAGLPSDAISLVPTRDRAAVGLMLGGLAGTVDVVVPRGGKNLVARVQSEARVPVFSHLDGNCHVYIHASADPAIALSVTLNAKMRRTGVCGAAETLLVDRGAIKQLPSLVTALLEAGCAVRGDAETCAVDPRVTPAVEADWATEFLDAIIAVRVVEGLDAAIHHIESHGSHHTDAIIAEDKVAVERFMQEVDSAILLHNASTQFADGGEFGFGAEIGIATGKMHARGPVGVEQLTSFNYRVYGSGQTRP